MAIEIQLDIDSPNSGGGQGMAYFVAQITMQWEPMLGLVLDTISILIIFGFNNCKFVNINSLSYELIWNIYLELCIIYTHRQADSTVNRLHDPDIPVPVVPHRASTLSRSSNASFLPRPRIDLGELHNTDHISVCFVNNVCEYLNYCRLCF